MDTLQWVLKTAAFVCPLQVSRGSNYSLQICPPFTIWVVRRFRKAPTDPENSGLGLNGPIRQLMSSMRAQLSLGKDKRSEPWSSGWPFPALFKSTLVTSAAKEYPNSWSIITSICYFCVKERYILKNDGPYDLHSDRRSLCLAFYFLLFLHQTYRVDTVQLQRSVLMSNCSWMTAKIIDPLHLSLISFFCYMWTSSIDHSSNLNRHSVLEADTNTNTAASGQIPSCT